MRILYIEDFSPFDFLSCIFILKINFKIDFIKCVKQINKDTIQNSKFSSFFFFQYLIDTSSVDNLINIMAINKALHFIKPFMVRLYYHQLQDLQHF